MQNTIDKSQVDWTSEYGDRLKSARVLVTGHSGFIGSHLCDALIALKAEVHGISIAPQSNDWGNAAHIHEEFYDLADLQAVERSIRQINPDFVFHLSGVVDTRPDMRMVLPTLQANLVSTVNLLTCLQNARVKKIMLAGSAEDGLSSGKHAPDSPYSASKTALLAYSKLFSSLYHYPVTVLRPYMGYGPRQQSSKLIPHVITSLLKGERPKVSSMQRRVDFVYVLDLVRGFLTASLASGGAGQVFDLSTGNFRRIREIVALIYHLMDIPLAEMEGTFANEELASSNGGKDMQPSTRILPGWQPCWGLEDGLKATISWYRSTFDR